MANIIIDINSIGHHEIKAVDSLAQTSIYAVQSEYYSYLAHYLSFMGYCANKKYHHLVSDHKSNLIFLSNDLTNKLNHESL